MKVKDIIKRQTTMVAMAVILVVITAIGVSYSVFFDVKKSNNQTITAGIFVLKVTPGSKLTDFNAKTDADGQKSTAFTYTVTNNGEKNSKTSNLPGKYEIYVYADTGNTAGLGNLMLSVNGGSAKAISSYDQSTCRVSDTNTSQTCYKIDTGSLIVGGTDSKNVKIWVNEDNTPESEDSKKVNLSLFIKGEVNESAVGS